MPKSNGSQDGSRSSVKPLEPTLRHQLESQLGTDLSGVCVAANHVPGILGTDSFVHGNTIYLNAGKIHPHTTAGRELIGHEAVHVVQQRSGIMQKPDKPRPSGSRLGSGVKTSDKRQAAVLAFIKG